MAGCMQVAHDLGAILQYDRVAVMEAGAVVEEGAPQVLLADERRVFTRMVAAAHSGVQARRP